MAESSDTMAERERVLAILAPVLVGHRDDATVHRAVNAIAHGWTKQQTHSAHGHPWQAGEKHDPSKG